MKGHEVTHPSEVRGIQVVFGRLFENNLRMFTVSSVVVEEEVGEGAPTVS